MKKPSKSPRKLLKKSTKRGFFQNPIDKEFLKRKLEHELIKFDERLKRTKPNLTRYETMMQALDRTFEPLTNDSSIEDVKLSLSLNFAYDFPPVVKFLKFLNTLPRTNPAENSDQVRKCSTCKEANWTCRDCGKKCCPCFCGSKTNFERILTPEGWRTGKTTNEYLATCTTCSRKYNHKFFIKNPKSILMQIEDLEKKHFGEPDMKSDKIFDHGYTNDELSRIYTEYNLKKYLKTHKYVLYKVLSKKPFKIKIRLFKETKIQNELVIKIKDSELIMKLAIIFGLESNDPDIDPVKFLIDYEEDNKYPQPFEVWLQIKRFIKYYQKSVIVEK